MGDARWQIEVLGPIRVVDADGRDRTPSGALQRRLLALLVLRRGHVVSADSAAEVLWPGPLPRDPAAALQNHVFRLRRSLPHQAIDSTAEGYRLDPGWFDLDADRLAEVVRERSSPDVSDRLEAVLERWRGPAYAELDGVDEALAEATRLEDVRCRAREGRAEERIARGDTDGLVAELTSLVDEHPLREQPRSLLMAALAATGRHVDALRAYDDFRRLLGDELGIVPSPALSAQHAALLDGAGARATVPTGRLPLSATTLVGRDQLAAEVLAGLASRRLVTLVGPGGVGKTRLLIEVGRRLIASDPERPVVLCELAAADSGTAVGVVGAALGIEPRPGIEPVDRIADVLGDGEAVLLLDNCEHLIDVAAHIVDRLLGHCAGLHVVATSRERLRVAGEHVHVVPTLPTGDPRAPAVELFLDRAADVVPGFRPDQHQLGHIVEIVQRLDGLPLAIELAAARLHTLDVDEIAAGLDERFSLLSTGARTSTRHRSLGAAVSWSFGLLDPDLQRTFADVSVFATPFALDDAAAVADIDPSVMASALGQLVERSLVMRAPGRRYVLLETLRAFGIEQLEADGRAEAVARRHAHHFAGWIDRAAQRLAEPAAPVLAEIDAAVSELRAALDWLLDHDEVEQAGRLVAGLYYYGFLRLRPDVLAWANRVIEADEGDRSPWAAKVWVVAAYWAWMAGDLAETGVRTERALRIARSTGRSVPTEVLLMLGNHELFTGRLDAAINWYHRALDSSDDAQRVFVSGSMVLALGYAGDPAAAELATSILTEVGDDRTPHAAYVWYCAGEADLTVDLDRARARFERAVEIAERTNASFVRELAIASMASIDARVGDPGTAAADYRRLIVHWRRAGMWSTQWTMLRSIAILLARLGRTRDAAVLEGAVRSTEAGHRIFGSDELALGELGAELRAALGDDEYRAALAEGAVLDGEGAVEHALRAL